ncbi:MAG: rhomboid family intramembrane serine protease [Pseudomonadota bacterium]
MLPIRDDNPQIYTPYVTYGVIAMNAIVWATLQGFGSEAALGESICRLGLIPADLLGTLESIDRQQPIPCRIDGQSDWITVLSSMFMHGSWMHILGNMWFLWIFGNNVEDAMGSVRFAIFYILSGIGAAAAQIIADPASPIPMVGASGAIGGVMGAYIVLYPRVHVHMFVFLGFIVTTFAVPAVAMLGYWLLLQIVGGITSIGAQGGGVAFWAHLGGFVAGAVLVFVFKDEQRLEQHPYRGWNQQRHASDLWRKVDTRRDRRWH